MNYHKKSRVFVSRTLDGSNGAIFSFAGRDWGSFNPKLERAAADKVVSILYGLGLSCGLLSPIHGLLVHGDNLFLCTEYTLQTEVSSVDALVTQVLYLPLFLYVADCPAVAIFDPVYKTAALVHSGRKGTGLNICQKTVSYMQAKFGSDPSDLLAVIAPYIGACGNECYELSLTAAEQVSIYYPKAVVGRNKNKVYLDIGEAISCQLSQAGLLTEHIEKSTLCTSCANGVFHSYRQRTPEEMRIKPNNGAILCLTEQDSQAAVNLASPTKQPLLIFALLF